MFYGLTTRHLRRQTALLRVSRIVSQKRRLSVPAPRISYPTLRARYQSRSSIPLHKSCQGNKLFRSVDPNRTISAAATPAASNSTTRPEPMLTPRLPEEVRRFWFEHLKQEEDFVLPSWSDCKRWFTRDVAFDTACVKQFGEILETIRTSNITASDLLIAMNPSSPLDWLGVILLLDQLPRNCYRGPESGVVFNVFDPLARHVALEANKRGIPLQSPGVRYRLAYRMWFYLPFMHSEDLALHGTAVAEYEKMSRDVFELLDGQPREHLGEDDEDVRKCQSVLESQSEYAAAFCANNLDFEVRHGNILEQFGRYPHRNEPLGRASTAEERSYLENGGETFS